MHLTGLFPQGIQSISVTPVSAVRPIHPSSTPISPHSPVPVHLSSITNPFQSSALSYNFDLSNAMIGSNNITSLNLPQQNIVLPSQGGHLTSGGNTPVIIVAASNGIPTSSMVPTTIINTSRPIIHTISTANSSLNSGTGTVRIISKSSNANTGSTLLNASTVINGSTQRIVLNAPLNNVHTISHVQTSGIQTLQNNSTLHTTTPGTTTAPIVHQIRHPQTIRQIQPQTVQRVQAIRIQPTTQQAQVLQTVHQTQSQLQQQQRNVQQQSSVNTSQTIITQHQIHQPQTIRIQQQPQAQQQQQQQQPQHQQSQPETQQQQQQHLQTQQQQPQQQSAAVNTSSAVAAAGGGGKSEVTPSADDTNGNNHSTDKSAIAVTTSSTSVGAEPDEPEIDIVINNVVCSFSVGCHLNLRQIALTAGNVEYKRESGMVSMKLRNPYTTASIWSSGKITCTGATSEETSKCAARRYARVLQRLGFRTRFRNFKIVNVLGTCTMPFAIKLVPFSQTNKPIAQYEPELHPGVTYKIKEIRATLKIFSTGSITVTAPSVAAVQESIERIFPLVFEHRKPRSCPEDMPRAQNQALGRHEASAFGHAAGGKALAMGRSLKSVEASSYIVDDEDVDDVMCLGDEDMCADSDESWG